MWLPFPALLDRDSELTVATQGQVQVSSASDEHRSFATLSLAFSSDPVARWCFPDADRYLTYWPQLMRAFAGAAFVDGAADSIDDCSGVALWLPPGVAPDDEAIGRILDEGVPATIHDELFSVVEQMGELHLTEPHWYLTFMGVDVTKQGRGYGSMLLRHALERGDKDGLPAYLDATSPGNKHLYERHGFKELGVIQAGSSPPQWSMRRSPG